jgi:hypothetical protein
VNGESLLADLATGGLRSPLLGGVGVGTAERSEHLRCSVCPTVAPSLFFSLAFARRGGVKKEATKWRVACTLRSVPSGRYFFFLFCFFCPYFYIVFQ